MFSELVLNERVSTAVQQTPLTGYREFVVCVVGRSRMCRDAPWVIAVCSVVTAGLRRQNCEEPFNFCFQYLMLVFQISAKPGLL